VSAAGSSWHRLHKSVSQWLLPRQEGACVFFLLQSSSNNGSAGQRITHVPPSEYINQHPKTLLSVSKNGPSQRQHAPEIGKKWLLRPAQLPGTNLAALFQALTAKGSAKWSFKFSIGPLPVTMACTAASRVSSYLHDEHIAHLRFTPLRCTTGGFITHCGTLCV
jgi:hypothetical protein